ncbi:MAG: MarC family protein [Candidatus Omnitrophica bacterium]|nr:MarC family protein [Candidatus Omnitrophota bacterium]
MKLISALFVSFFALFIVIDAVGLVPVFLSITKGMQPKRRKDLLRRSVISAALICIVFMILGGLIFWILGVTIADFQVAGGILLLVFSIRFLIQKNEPKRIAGDDMAIVPLATPLIAGPAVLTILLALKTSYGFIVTLIALLLNMPMVFFIFYHSELIAKALGDSGMKAISKVVEIILSAFAVMLIRKGLMEFLQNMS